MCHLRFLSRSSVVALLCGLGVLFPAQAAAQQGSPVDSVLALDSAWARAYAEHDTTTAQALFAQDILITSDNGMLKTREQELGDVRPYEGLRMHYFRTRDVQSRVRRDVVVVAGLAEWEFTYNGQVRSFQRRYTATYTRGGPLGWEMIALHIGPAPETEPEAS